MSDRIYFQVIKGGFTDKVITEFKNEMQTIHDSWVSIAEKYSVERSFQGNRLIALFFEDGNPPEGWVNTKHLPKNCYKPSRKKVCMEAYNEFRALKSKLSSSNLEHRLKTGAPCDGRKMYFPSYETIGRDVILNLHPKHDVPDGVLRLKTSEYWELKELSEVA